MTILKFKRLIKFFISQKYISTLKAFIYMGNNVFCPCCKKRFRKFLTIFGRPNAMCPFCGSLERHRLIYLYLKEKTKIFTNDVKLFHFAPEDVFISIFSSKKNIKYYTGDLNSCKASIKMDITKIPCKKRVIDVILCIHVLEHILDDKKAMSEMYRILNDKGWALLQHPIDKNRDKTYEDLSKITPKEREMAFLQVDHVRIYGTDLKRRLETAGFTVKVEDCVKQFDNKMIEKYGLMKNELIYLCYKANKKS